jgi:hypothetical protein
VSPVAIDITYTRGLHVAELARDALRNIGRYLATRLFLELTAPWAYNSLGAENICKKQKL